MFVEWTLIIFKFYIHIKHSEENAIPEMAKDGKNVLHRVKGEDIKTTG